MDQFVLISKGPLSQYHKCDMEIDGVKFISAVQYMLYKKAGKLFLLATWKIAVLHLLHWGKFFLREIFFSLLN